MKDLFWEGLFRYYNMRNKKKKKIFLEVISYLKLRIQNVPVKTV